MKRNREGYLVSETERECTVCGTIFKKTSRTVVICNACNSSRVKSEDPVVRMWRRAKGRAKQRGQEFSLTREDIKIPTHCPILGLELQVHQGISGGRPNSPALDRIDNTKGYTKDNVVVVSHLANMMKSSASVEELIKFSEWVQRTYVNTAKE